MTEEKFDIEMFERALRDLEFSRPRVIYKVVHPSVRHDELYMCMYDVIQDGYNPKYDRCAFDAYAAFYAGYQAVRFYKMPMFEESD